eukprot:CAMPEP_0119553812 /NCGR_PEP_ID=MMETSP1352-20130426/6472_1 /TAXON_ID=265584 /ORGANISM="Stauroneis constricta, Strain CCMP1120" /LENGTH=1218 /DNA_ID=CAMNT_0007600295 /DNA_START=114 /DNA_END=3770 /DNA_ORIENTATION=+
MNRVSKPDPTLDTMDTKHMWTDGGGDGAKLEHSFNEEEDNSSVAQRSTSGDSSHNREHHHGTPNSIMIASKETRALRSIKCIVVVVLLGITALLATGVFFHTSSSEEEQFEEQFAEYANKILEDIGDTMRDTLQALDLLSSEVASSAQQQQLLLPQGQNHQWPRVTVPTFGLLAAKTISLSKIKVLVMCVIITAKTRNEWQNYTAQVGRSWVDETVDILETDSNYYGPINREYFVNNKIHGDGGKDLSDETQLMFPSWQAYPVVPKWPPYNYDYLALAYTKAHRRMIDSSQVVITEPYMLPDPDNEEEVGEANSWAEWYAERISPDEVPLEPASEIYFPIFNSTNTIQVDTTKSKPVAGFAASFYWRDMFRSIIPNGAQDMVVVTSNPCAPSFTYQIAGPNVIYLGRGDHHDSKFDGMAVAQSITALESFNIQNSTYSGPRYDTNYCPNTFTIYPTTDMEDRFLSSDPTLFTVGAVLICAMTSLTFLLYDVFVERRQRAVLDTAKRSNAVVSSLFPEDIRDRLYNEADATANGNQKGGASSVAVGASHSDGTMKRSQAMSDRASIPGGKPIAELYTATTIMFGDIVGFTSWSASREPAAVFTLLETIYSVFDSNARRRGVFKVETIGDCYVAVCGLPQPRDNHALVMVRFAAECRRCMHELTKELVASLGPGTADLKMRFGLNSGPTTAGVLRGDRSRFQLFGDTVNTAARMESLGMPDRIHVSPKTADLIVAAGKHGWITPREDVIAVKGKGEVQTFWVEIGNKDYFSSGATVKAGGGVATLSETSSSATDEDDKAEAAQGKQQRGHSSRIDRLVHWNVDMLEGMLKRVIAHNRTNGNAAGIAQPSATPPPDTSATEMHRPRQELDAPIKFDTSTNASAMDVDISTLPPLPQATRKELQDLVSNVAYLHNSANPFHNFEHATHVVMATRKIFSRMQQLNTNQSNESSSQRIVQLIKSDPIVQFAATFASLVHDLDHPGVPNHVLIKERSRLASMYGNESVAEQNSIVNGWELLMSEPFENLRKCLFGSFDSDGEDKSNKKTKQEERMELFRSIMVHTVMATDIFDKDLKASRDDRWNKYRFDDGVVLPSSDASDDAENLRCAATSIMEHMIQASDVAHTMEHWTIFEKWNHQLFLELRQMHRCGRSDQDPADGWYQGEMWFFDSYVVPLARKMKASGIFDEAWCNESLQYAQTNRDTWEAKGRDIVRSWIQEGHDDA